MASASDNFDRANGEIGANWTEDNGDIDIVSNQAAAQTASEYNNMRYTATAMDGNDHYVQVNHVAVDGKHRSGITARQASDGWDFYQGMFYEADNESGYRLYKYVDGVDTQLDSAASGNGTKTGKLTVDGASQSYEIDSVEVCSDTDTDVTTGTYCGLFTWNNVAIWDDWSAADLGAPPAAAPTAILDGPLAGPLGGPM